MTTPRPVVVLTALTVAGILSSRDLSARELTFAERVKAQEAIERVYSAHRIGDARPFAEILPRPVLEAKVRLVLARSAALERFWSTPITGAMLRDEAERIARQTRLPERLQEIQDALGGDAFLFQETVARATLVDRLIRGFYARDGVLHAAARAEAEDLRQRLSTGALSPSTAEAHRSVMLALLDAGEDGPGAGASSSGAVRVGPEAFRRLVESSPSRPGTIGPLTENVDGFSFSVVLEAGTGRLRLATYSITKRSFDEWWAGVESSLDTAAVGAVAETGGPLPALTPGCGADTWQAAGLSDLPDGRMLSTVVWTGTEMIVWGGTDYISSVLMNSGGRYDPLTDSWSATSTLNAPSGRVMHTAVWTGSRMIVWGGSVPGDGPSNTGGRYDPITNTWVPTSALNAPTPRQYHVAVWTGSRMVVWGGFAIDGIVGGPTQTGGQYDPATNTWTATAPGGAPAGRLCATAVWTGSRMLVWGGGFYVSNGSGYTYTFLSDGALYDPASNAWQGIATANAPTARWRHTAVWTGTKMLVWGGENYTVDPVAGGRYDLGSNTWSPMSSTGQPTIIAGQGGSNTRHTAVWTGDRMIVWGGNWSATGAGGLYDPSSDTWSATSTVGAPQGRWQHMAVWTGSRMIIWGGTGPNPLNNPVALNDGGRYNPADDTWTPTSMGTVPQGRSGHTAVWTGNELIVWGGTVPASNGFTTTTNTGGRYDPALDQWTPTTTSGAPAARASHAAVWSGQSMIVFGGGSAGARYDPLTDTWQPTSAVGALPPTYNPVAFWTGKRMLVWGGTSGSSLSGAGALYDPVADQWSATASRAGMRGPAAAWTGREMLVWGGRDFLGQYPQTGSRYDPGTNTWRTMSIVNAPSGREGASGVWTGHDVIVWGGMVNSSFVGTGGRYDMTSDSWSPIATTGAPTATTGHPAVWTGDRMVVWGGAASGGMVRSGGRYDPISDSWVLTSTATAPIPRQGHTALWTPWQMLVWGGNTRYESLSTGSRYCACAGSASTFYQDLDGDGHGDPGMPIYACVQPPGSAPAGDDCSDADAGDWAVPSEVPRLDFTSQTDLAWLPPVNPGATTVAYDLLRSPDPADFVTNATCLPVDPGAAAAADAETPPLAGFFFYVVRAKNACPGGIGPLGSGSDGSPRLGLSCP